MQGGGRSVDPSGHHKRLSLSSGRSLHSGIARGNSVAAIRSRMDVGGTAADGRGGCWAWGLILGRPFIRRPGEIMIFGTKVKSGVTQVTWRSPTGWTQQLRGQRVGTRLNAVNGPKAGRDWETGRPRCFP